MMHLENRSLRSRIVLGGVLMVLIPLLVVGGITFLNSWHTLGSISREQKAQLAQSLTATIQDSLERELSIVRATAADSAVIAAAARGDFVSLEGRLRELYGKIGAEYESFSVYDSAGTIQADPVDRRRIGISIADRDYFREGPAGKPGIGPVNASRATGSPVFGISAPILGPDGRFLGGVLAVIKAEFLGRRLASLKQGRTGYAFMLDQHGVVMAHPEERKILVLNASREPGFEHVAARMLRGQTGVEAYRYQGVEKIAGFAPVARTGWSVCVTQNKAEIMALAYQNMTLSLLAGALFFTLAVAAMFYYSGVISEPVQKTLVVLRQAIEQAGEAVFLIGLERKIQFVNPAMAAIVDRPLSELVDRDPCLENAVHTPTDEIWGILEGGRVWRGRLEGTKRDGTPFAMEASITPVRTELGKIGGYLGIGRDISRELMIEAQLRQGQKMEAIGTLAGGIAHDFNNILGVIFGYTELALQSAGKREEVAACLKEILEAGGRARDLVNRILTFSRQAGEEKRPLMPRPIVKETLKLLRASLPTTIAIEERVTSGALVLADPTQVHQVIMNLCTNAGYAMKERGGVLSVRLNDIVLDEAACAHQAGAQPGAYVLLEVRDSGPGIPSAIRHRIFDPFFTTKPKGEGTGLGLSMVHGIVKAMGGFVTVASVEGQGAQFSVYLPIYQGKPAPASLAADPPEVPGGSERILFVDDEEALLRAAKAALERMGYRVEGISGSRAALERFGQAPHDFDAVITDFTMPQMTGYELALRLREIRRDIPILLCSGYLDPTTEDVVRDARIDEFVRKPATKRDLALALRRVLDRVRGAH